MLHTSHHAFYRARSWNPHPRSADSPATLPPDQLRLVDMPAAQADAQSASLGLAVIICTYQRPQSLARFLESLATQNFRPQQLIIVDASQDHDTELMMQQYERPDNLADQCLYFRVTGPLRGITHQRNFGLGWVTSDLVAFFDDDIILLPNCLREMERTYRQAGDIVGVGAFMRNQAWPIEDSWVWQARRRLKLVPDLQPGRYHRSGISVPWNLTSSVGLTEGDWLPGCAMLWNTAIARETRFYEGFAGYAQGEDLEFSLRMRARGRLVVSGAAQVVHMYEQNGRPDPIKKGYMAIYNRYQIHRRAVPNRTWRDIAWFSYALALDTLLLARFVIVPEQWGAILLQIAGRMKAVYAIISKRVKRNWRHRAKAPANSATRQIPKT